MITAQSVIETLKVVEAKGSLETVRRLTQRLNEVMVYAMNCGLLQANPISNILAAFKKPTKQNMKKLGSNELPALMNALANASIKRSTRCLIEFQLHTMTRPNEAAGAKWAEFDLLERVWLIPLTHTNNKCIAKSQQLLVTLQFFRTSLDCPELS